VAGGISDAKFATFNTYFLLLSAPAQQLGYLIGTAEQVTAFLNRVFGVLDATSPVPGTARPEHVVEDRLVGSRQDRLGKQAGEEPPHGGRTVAAGPAGRRRARARSRTPARRTA